MPQRHIAVAAVATVLSFSASAEEPPISVSPAQVKSLAIVVQPLASLKASAARLLPAQVVVPPAQVEIVSAPLPGLVTAVRVAAGESVKRGQPLARLQGAQMLELQSGYLQAQSQAQLAAETRRRDESLFADGIIAQARLSASRTAERQAEAMLAEKRQSLRLAGLAAPDASARGFSGTSDVRAPFDGIVLESGVSAGQRVDGTAPLFKLARTGRLWLEIQANTSQAAGLAPGDTVEVPGCAPGRLTLVAPHLNAASQTLLLRAELANPAGCVKPFQFLQASITPRHVAGNSWRVPAAAVTRHQGRAWLFAEVPGGFRPVEVTLLDETGQSPLVTGPLGPDTRIAVRGAAALKAAWLGLGAANAGQ